MKNVLKSVAALTAFLLTVCGFAGCTPAEAGPEYETAYIIDEYAELVDTTQCLVEGDPVEAVTTVHIKGNDARRNDAVYTEFSVDYGQGLPALVDINNGCVIFTVDKNPVIKVLDWDKIYYVVPAQSEEDARNYLADYMRAYAISCGIDEE